MGRRKRKVASRSWKKDVIRGVKLKSVVPLNSNSNIFIKNGKNIDKNTELVLTDFLRLSDLKKGLKNVIQNINASKTKEKLIFALKWLPSAEDYKIHSYALFLPKNQLGKGVEENLIEQELIHGYYDKFIIISSRSKKLEYYSSTIDFFFAFNQVMIKSKRQNPLLLRELTGFSANPAFLLFSDTKGNGMLIKSLEDTKYSGGINNELDVLRLGLILGANIPKNAIVVHNTRHKIYKSFSKNAEILVESLTPVAEEFRYVDNEVIDTITEKNAVDLGKIFVFDIVAGSWDRHAGNYLVTTIRNKPSLQEIDFGLFQPDFYPDDNFKEEDDYRQTYPSKHPQYPGWGILINSKVRKMMKNSDQTQFVKGMMSAIKKLKQFLRKEDLTKIVSEKFSRRAKNLFKENSPTQNLFFSEIEKLEIDLTLFEDVLS